MNYIVLVTVILVMLIHGLIFADGSGNNPYELFIGTINTDGYSIEIEVEKIGASWDDSFELTNGFNGSDFSFNGS